ncbi:MAG: hypothetical protein ACJAYF_003850 [Arenicella sp.]
MTAIEVTVGLAGIQGNLQPLRSINTGTQKKLVNQYNMLRTLDTQYFMLEEDSNAQILLLGKTTRIPEGYLVLSIHLPSLHNIAMRQQDLFKGNLHEHPLNSRHLLDKSKQ